ncbi:MAG TPA: hypothetical protein DIT89_03025 [Planctomycetaceae bacterium]|nr:hypothetical protein [Planctomycetaceae bacterium]
MKVRPVCSGRSDRVTFGAGGCEGSFRWDRTADSSPDCWISHQTFAWKTTVEWGISSDPLWVDLWKLSSRPGA